MTTHPDPLLDRLLQALRWRASVFHAGRYCGAWRATTAGKGLASFHWVLEGRCWLHRPGQPALPLRAGQGVILLRDEPHRLSPFADPTVPTRAQAMAPICDLAGESADGEGCSLVCGFLRFDGAAAAVLMTALPPLLTLDDPACARLLPLLLDEARAMASPEQPTLLMQRLADLLLMLCLRGPLRQALAQPGRARGLWSLAAEPALAPLLLALLEEPAAAWTAESMAARLHMSRARFFRLFTLSVGQPPAQFLLELRMQLAAQHLRAGETIARTAEQVGYQSPAAFARAFQKVNGAQPGRFRRDEARLY